MIFFKPYFFDKHKKYIYENLSAFKMRLIIPYYYKDETNCIMKIKGPFMKVVSLNEVVKHPLFKPNFDIRFFFHFLFFNIHIIQ
jgi:hypothetical protein